MANGDNRDEQREGRGEEEGENSSSSILSNKDRIYQYVTNNPGCHLRRISKDLGLAMGDTQYHLKTLEKTNMIKSRRMGVFRRYYTFSISGERLESLLAILRQEVPRDIIIFLIENPGASQAEVARHKHFSAPTINWHMSRLIESGLVSSHKEGKSLSYHIEGNIKDITAILRAYYPSIWTKLSNRLADLFLDISAGSRIEINNNYNERKEMTERTKRTTTTTNKKNDDAEEKDEEKWDREIE